MKFLGGRSVIGGIVTVVTECNCGSNSVVDLLGGTGWRKKYLVEKGITKIKIMTGGKLTSLYCWVKLPNIEPDKTD